MAKKKKKKNSYTEEDLKDCLNAITKHNMKVKKAAQQYGIPSSTVFDRLHGKTKADSKRGPKRVLTEEEETSLYHFCVHMSEIGCGITVAMLCCFALAIIQEREPSRKLPPKKDWARKFRNRHNLSLKKASVVTRALYCNSSVENFDLYFKKLGDVYAKYNIGNKPAMIWNMDESWFGKKQEGFRRRTIAKRGSSPTYQQQVFTAEHTTLLSCANAAGDVMPSCLIYTDCLPAERYKNLFPDDWVIGWTKSGYVSKQLFEQWFEKVFVPRCGATKDQPVLLIMDNCAAHFSLKVIKLAQANNIHIMCEPAHTSHHVQPMDKLFHPLQDEFSKRCHASKCVDIHATVNKGSFVVKLHEAMDHAWSPGAVKGAFRRTGIYPLDRTKISNEGLPSKSPSPSSSTSSGSVSSSLSPKSPRIRCSTCGARPNVLVETGLVNKSLQHVLLPPNIPDARKEKKQPNRRSLVPSGTLITCEYAAFTYLCA